MSHDFAALHRLNLARLVHAHEARVVRHPTPERMGEDFPGHQAADLPDRPSPAASLPRWEATESIPFTWDADVPDGELDFWDDPPVPSSRKSLRTMV